MIASCSCKKPPGTLFLQEEPSANTSARQPIACFLNCKSLHLLLRQAIETPFGASDQQEADGSPGTAAVDRNSTIDEAAEDIAEAWRKAPQPRRDAHRHRADEQGPPCLYRSLHGQHIVANMSSQDQQRANWRLHLYKAAHCCRADKQSQS